MIVERRSIKNERGNSHLARAVIPSSDIEPASCGVAYIYLVLSAIAHVMRRVAWCDDEDSDDEECTGTMYT